jgi:hypothetical protein
MTAVLANPTSAPRKVSIRAVGWASVVMVDAPAGSIVTVVIDAASIESSVVL